MVAGDISLDLSSSLIGRFESRRSRMSSLPRHGSLKVRRRMSFRLGCNKVGNVSGFRITTGTILYDALLDCQPAFSTADALSPALRRFLFSRQNT
jgi:hypothetical protein